ncbi:hypothetical protein XELAEV_18038085mg, partial [Xenopus laevis]
LFPGIRSLNVISELADSRESVTPQDPQLFSSSPYGVSICIPSCSHLVTCQHFIPKQHMDPLYYLLTNPD